MTSNPAFSFNQSELTRALTQERVLAQPVNQVTVVIPYWQRFRSSIGNAALAPFEISAALAGALMAVIKAIIRRIAALFNYSQVDDENGASALAKNLSQAVPGGDDLGPTMALTGEADGVAQLMTSIDQELAQLAERVKPLLNRTPKDVDFMDKGGVAILQEQLLLVAEFMSKAREVVEVKEKNIETLAQAHADLNRKKIEGRKLPFRPAQTGIEDLSLALSTPEQLSITKLSHEIKGVNLKIKAAEDSFVEICATAKSLGDGSEAYFAARRLMDRYATKEMVERIEAASVNKFAEISPARSISEENTGNEVVDSTNSQTELQVAKNDKVVKIRRAERFQAADSEVSEGAAVKFEQQR